MPPKSSTATVRELVPLLIVHDIRRSVVFYRDLLGFEIVQTWEPHRKLAWCYVRRGGAAVMLQQESREDGPQDGRGRGVIFYFNCEDADALHAELSKSGLMLDPPQSTSYGMKQFLVRDPDGYQHWFQSQSERK